jgi:hypothetical protein
MNANHKQAAAIQELVTHLRATRRPAADPIWKKLIAFTEASRNWECGGTELENLRIEAGIA